MWLIVISIIIIWAIVFFIRREEKEKRTKELIEESDKMMKTSFFDELSKRIYKEGFYGIGVTEWQVYELSWDINKSIKFKEMGYRNLSKEEVKTLEVSLGRLEGYITERDYADNVKIVRDMNYWRPIYEKEKRERLEKESSTLKDIY